MDKTWKQLERRVARVFRARRNSLSGRNSKVTAADCIHPELFIEVKLRSRDALFTLFEKVIELANREGKVPVVVLHQKGKKYNIVCCRLHEILKVAGNVDLAEVEEL
jgi:hypothetical protein